MALGGHAHGHSDIGIGRGEAVDSLHIPLHLVPVGGSGDLDQVVIHAEVHSAGLLLAQKLIHFQIQAHPQIPARELVSHVGTQVRQEAAAEFGELGQAPVFAFGKFPVGGDDAQHGEYQNAADEQPGKHLALKPAVALEGCPPPGGTFYGLLFHGWNLLCEVQSAECTVMHT